jgi:hypothetical protein
MIIDVVVFAGIAGAASLFMARRRRNLPRRKLSRRTTPGDSGRRSGKARGAPNMLGLVHGVVRWGVGILATGVDPVPPGRTR